MTAPRPFLSSLAALGRRLLGVPILVKVLGIGALVAFLFGSVILLRTRGTLSRALHEMLAERALSGAETLAAQLERPLIANDLLAVRDVVRQHQERGPDIRYIVVRDAASRPVAHTFSRGVPTDLDTVRGDPESDPRGVVVLAERDGLIFDARVPVLSGYAGSLQLGVSDSGIVRAQSKVTGAVLWALALAAALGIGLAYMLAHILTGPIERLGRAADRIRDGDFGARAVVEWSDEVGHLAVAFNRMAGHLERYRGEVHLEERARLALIERLIRAQEEERKAIGLELHDHVGQSLLALLMTVQSTCVSRGICDPALDGCPDVSRQVVALIDDVRRLAWGMRPSILDDYGLDLALGRHVQEVARQSAIEIDYQYSACPGLGRMPPEAEITLFRIAQEALANILRHAQTSRASVVVLQGRSEVSLILEDFGRGFDPQLRAREERPCLGLAGMAERAALLGGTCLIESVPGRGTTVRAQIPLVREDAPCPSAS